VVIDLAMFLVLLVTLVLLARWLVSEARVLKKSVEELRTVTANPGVEELKDAIKDISRGAEEISPFSMR
jgi:hypothetical protein